MVTLSHFLAFGKFGWYRLTDAAWPTRRRTSLTESKELGFTNTGSDVSTLIGCEGCLLGTSVHSSYVS